MKDYSKNYHRYIRHLTSNFPQTRGLLIDSSEYDCNIMLIHTIYDGKHSIFALKGSPARDYGDGKERINLFPVSSITFTIDPPCKIFDDTFDIEASININDFDASPTTLKKEGISTVIWRLMELIAYKNDVSLIVGDSSQYNEELQNKMKNNLDVNFHELGKFKTISKHLNKQQDESLNDDMLIYTHLLNLGTPLPPREIGDDHF